jgi:hypothetical protein
MGESTQAMATGCDIIRKLLSERRHHSQSFVAHRLQSLEDAMLSEAQVLTAEATLLHEASCADPVDLTWNQKEHTHGPA